jgi:signal transduction histidine kinase
MPTEAELEIDRTTLLRKLNWRLEFQDTSLQQEFTEFCRYQKLLWMVQLSVLVHGGVVSCSSIAAFGYNMSLAEWMFCMLLLFCGLVCLYTGGIVCLDCTKTPAQQIANSSSVERTSKYIANVQAIHYLSIYGFYIVTVTKGFFFQDCDLFPHDIQRYFIGWHCSYQGYDIPVYSMTLLVAIPIFIIVSLNETRVVIVMFGFLCNVAAHLSVAVYGEDRNFVWSVVVLAVCLMFFCIDLHLFRLKNFLNHRKLRETLLENERMHEESKASELRNMIGNLAHDLKTPLQSFMVGLDMIEHGVKDIDDLHTSWKSKTNLQESSVNTKDASSHLDQLGTFVTSLRQSCRDAQSTHSFMLMTINRCIDFTKASRGLKLSPKYDTFDLDEAIGMILNCMRNIQDRINIVMMPIAEEICSHIITDKQWLQENVLCLLSNAVKYSSSGDVRIQLMLVEDVVLSETASVATIEEVKDDGDDDEVQEPQLPGVQSSLLMSLQYLIKSNEPKIHPDVPAKARKVYATKSRLVHAKPKQSISRLRFEIEDSGIGLSEEAMKTLFNPFQQAQRLAGGTGTNVDT